MRRVTWIVAGVLLALCGLVFGCQRRALFPGGGPAPTERLVDRTADALALDVVHPEGVSEGVLLPPLTGRAPYPVVVFAHGNGELIDQWATLLTPYRRRGLAVALLEYRGYGRSDGAAAQDALVADSLAFVRRLEAHPAVDATRIVFHGRSLGGGVLAGVVADRPPRALIIESSFTAIRDLAWERWSAPSFLVRDPFDSRAALAGYRGPSLVLHGRSDQLIPFAHGERLAAHLGARFMDRECGHNDCPRDAVYWQAIWDLLNEAEVL